jgi:formamidopyrimidine-DNA glycosylase
MPELPEVETVMNGLRARMEGRTITRAAVNRPDMRWAFPAALTERLTGARVGGFRRRGKYILMRLGDGWSVLLHLGMSGRIVISPGVPNRAEPHEHLVMETDEGWRIGFVDPRRFGSVDLVRTSDEDRHRLLAGLGPEPLGSDFTPALLSAALAGKRTPIKAALLDQGVVAGLGNIYVCEALFRAAISPRRLARTIPGMRAARLVPAIQATLMEAIKAGGSSLRDYVQPSGELGYFQHAWKVYGREGQPCERCDISGTGRSCPGIMRIQQSGRSTFFCPRLQK